MKEQLLSILIFHCLQLVCLCALTSRRFSAEYHYRSISFHKYNLFQLLSKWYKIQLRNRKQQIYKNNSDKNRFLLKVTSNLHECPSEKKLYARCFQGNAHRLCIKRKICSWRLGGSSVIALFFKMCLRCFSYGVTLSVNEFQVFRESLKKMVIGVASLVKMCRNRSGPDELMVILNGTAMFANGFV